MVIHHGSACVPAVPATPDDFFPVSVPGRSEVASPAATTHRFIAENHQPGACERPTRRRLESEPGEGETPLGGTGSRSISTTAMPPGWRWAMATKVITAPPFPLGADGYTEGIGISPAMLYAGQFPPRHDRGINQVEEGPAQKGSRLATNQAAGIRADLANDKVTAVQRDQQTMRLDSGDIGKPLDHGQPERLPAAGTAETGSS